VPDIKRQKRFPRRTPAVLFFCYDAIFNHGLSIARIGVAERRRFACQCFHRGRHGEFHAGHCPYLLYSSIFLGSRLIGWSTSLQYGHIVAKSFAVAFAFVVRFGPYYAYLRRCTRIIGGTCESIRIEPWKAYDALISSLPGMLYIATLVFARLRLSVDDRRPRNQPFVRIKCIDTV